MDPLVRLLAVPTRTSCIDLTGRALPSIFSVKSSRLIPSSAVPSEPMTLISTVTSSTPPRNCGSCVTLTIRQCEGTWASVAH